MLNLKRAAGAVLVCFGILAVAGCGDLPDNLLDINSAAETEQTAEQAAPTNEVQEPLHYQLGGNCANKFGLLKINLEPNYFTPGATRSTRVFITGTDGAILQTDAAYDGTEEFDSQGGMPGFKWSCANLVSGQTLVVVIEEVVKDGPEAGSMVKRLRVPFTIP